MKGVVFKIFKEVSKIKKSSYIHVNYSSLPVRKSIVAIGNDYDYHTIISILFVPIIQFQHLKNTKSDCKEFYRNCSCCKHDIRQDKYINLSVA